MKRLSIVLIMLTIASIANADLILTINGIDATEEFVKIEGKDDLVIAVAGSTEAVPNAYYIKAAACTLEATTGPDTVSPQEHNDKYFLAFGDESSLVFVSLIANNYMIVDGTSVEKGDTIYELVLFYISETNTVVALGIKFESFGYIPPEPEPKAEAQSEPEAELEQQAQFKEQVSEPETLGFGTLSFGDCNEILDPNWYPNLNNDQFVNFKDFAILAADWLQSGSEIDGDINGNDIVDFNDLEILAYYWMANTCGPSPEEVFESFKSALLADDVNEAVSYFAEVSAENYRLLMEQLRPYFTQMVNDMGEMIFIRFDSDMVVYDLLREEDGDIYGYPVTFIRDKMGHWKIYDF